MDQTTASETLNTSMHRTPGSVWERRGWNGSRQMNLTRILVGAGGAALAVQGWRHGTREGRFLAGLGGALAWWAATSDGADLACARQWFSQILDRMPWRHEDQVMEASAASFPASDAPSWTPTVGTGLRRNAR